MHPGKAPHMSHERSAIAFQDGGASRVLSEPLDRRGIEYGFHEGEEWLVCGAFNPWREHSSHIREWRAQRTTGGTAGGGCETAPTT